MTKDIEAEAKVARLARAALARNPAACFALAVRYHKGHGVERNEAAARALFERAASLGHRQAAFVLERLWGGRLLHVGGDRLSEGSSLRIISGQAEQRPGLVLLSGAPVPPASPEAAAPALEPAPPAPELPEALPEFVPPEEEVAPPEPPVEDAPPAEKPGSRATVEETANPADVFYATGWAYACGSGVSQNWEKAVEWYRKAADLGHMLAQISLGNCLREGRGTIRDAVGSVRLYTLAAEQGFADAQCNLGWCYGTGFGVPRNYSAALSWYGKAAAQGNAIAKHNFDVALREFDAQLSRRALPLEQEALHIASDETLEFNGRKCCLYIPRQHRELVNLKRRETRYTYHLCACKSMLDMLGTSRSALYSATSRADGRFEVSILERDNAQNPMSWRPYDIRIELCLNCRSILLEHGLYSDPFSLRDFDARVQTPLLPLEGEAVQRPITLSFLPPVAVALPPGVLEEYRGAESSPGIVMPGEEGRSGRAAAPFHELSL